MILRNSNSVALILKAGELLSWFYDREVIYTVEGIIGVAQLVCKKA